MKARSIFSKRTNCWQLPFVMIVFEYNINDTMKQTIYLNHIDNMVFSFLILVTVLLVFTVGSIKKSRHTILNTEFDEFKMFIDSVKASISLEKLMVKWECRKQCLHQRKLLRIILEQRTSKIDDFLKKKTSDA